MEQEQATNWLQEEAKKLNTEIFDGDKLPALVFEENKTVTFTIDFSEKFKLWTDNANESIKAIIPVKHEEEAKILWLNIKNPLYSQIILKGLEGVTKFKIIQTGSKKNTRYTILEE